MRNLIRPFEWIALQLPSDTLKVLQIVPNTTISIGKYGGFHANQILGRPHHLTFEIVGENGQTSLRTVPAAELHEDVIQEELALSNAERDGSTGDLGDGVEFEVVDPEGKVVMRTNKDIVDDNQSQKLTMDEIELLKKQETGAGKDIIEKILSSHTTIDQKTAFALAKYTLRKAKKYLRRFTVLPLDVPLLANWIFKEKEPLKIMEIREEMLALIGSWSNVHCWNSPSLSTSPLQRVLSKNGVHHNDAKQPEPQETPFEGLPTEGRYLVIDETGGLLVASLAERMGILYPELPEEPEKPTAPVADELDIVMDDLPLKDEAADSSATPRKQTPRPPITEPKFNTITLLHANSQPNLSLLTYFSYDANTPSPTHPLTTHLKSLSWLQLLSPSSDAAYTEPEIIPPHILSITKASKRGTYYRKRRRWQRTVATVDSTRAGQFDGLICASFMSPASILQHTVPLLRGGAQIVVYSASIEPLSQLVDYYSTARRSEWLNNPSVQENYPGDEDFPVDPTLVLAPTVYTSRAREWQVLPGRSHPLMTGRGGAEGYVFVGTRVIPAQGRVEARGSHRRRKLVDDVSTPTSG